MPDSARPIDLAVAQLRREALAVPAGTSLGGEEALQQRLGVSRPTMRQAARILEREGLLMVRRGSSGGYFTARPDAGFIEATVASYLEALEARPDDLTRVASALWLEAVAKAAGDGGAGPRSLPPGLRSRVAAVKAGAGFDTVMAIEQAMRKAVFAAIDSPYIELIFDINANFARRRLAEPPAARDGAPGHADFVIAWRRAALLQLEGIADGDVEVAILAARRCRTLLHRRIFPAD